MFRVLPRRILLTGALLITAVICLTQISAAQDPNHWPVSVKPHGKDTTKNPPDPTPSIFVQVGTKQRLEFKMADVPTRQYHEGQDKPQYSWLIPAYVRVVAPSPDPSGIKTKPSKTFDYLYFGEDYSPQSSANGVSFADTQDFTVSPLDGTTQTAEIDFTPKKAGYWSIEVDFTAVVADHSTSPPGPPTIYTGKGFAFIVAAQATIVTDPPSVTNVIVGQQLNLSVTILPKDIDTKSGQDVSSSKNDSTTYKWSVPNDPLTNWKALVNMTDVDRDPMKIQKFTDSTPVKFTDADSKTPAPHFFWYHNGSTSGVTQTVSAAITDPAWTDAKNMPFTLTPTQDFALYRPNNILPQPT